MNIWCFSAFPTTPSDNRLPENLFGFEHSHMEKNRTVSSRASATARAARMVQKLERIEMAQLAVSSILFKSFCRVAGGHCWPPGL
jgi:hypothetical protein